MPGAVTCFTGIPVAILVLVRISPGAAAEPAFPPLIVPERRNPVAPTVSSQLQEMISGPVANAPSPATGEEWRALRKAFDTDAAANAAELADQRGITATLSDRAGVPVRMVTPARIAPENADRLMVHLHGGAYVFSAGPASVLEALLVADTCQTPVISVDYASNSP